MNSDRSSTPLPTTVRKSPQANPTRTVAVIDVGTTSIRLQLAEVGSRGVVTLETLSQHVSLGRDVFSNGAISRSTIEQCVSVLRQYREKLAEYQLDRPDQVRVVATTAVREATNRLEFIDRIYVATGLTVETIDVAEVHRVTYRGIQPLLKSRSDLFHSLSAVVEVSGGSTELLVLEEGNVLLTQAFRLGSLRLQQMLQNFQVPATRVAAVLDGEIQSLLEGLPERLPKTAPLHMIALGGDIRFAAIQLLGKVPEPHSLTELPLELFRPFVERIIESTDEELVEEFHLAFSEAETVGAALLTYLRMAELLGVDKLYVTAANLRDGFVREMSEGRNWSAEIHQQIIRSAEQLARRYHVDEDHARHVAELSRKLFRQLRKEHQLEERFETLLYVSALLHEVGGYINSSSIHKHSMYIVNNSELFGLTADEVLIVGLTTRYHRRSFPKPTHQPYSTLDRDHRVIVCKLAALLRLAIALDAARCQRITEVEVQRSGTRIVIAVPGIDDLAVEQLALPPARQFFESIFGLQVVLRSKTRVLPLEPSSQL